jgi:hypothetical protein
MGDINWKAILIALGLIGVGAGSVALYRKLFEDDEEIEMAETNERIIELLEDMKAANLNSTVITNLQEELGKQLFESLTPEQRQALVAYQKSLEPAPIADQDDANLSGSQNGGVSSPAKAAKAQGSDWSKTGFFPAMG